MKDESVVVEFRRVFGELNRAEFIDWRQRYLDEVPPSLRSEEEALLNAVGPGVRHRSDYAPGELERVNRWKLPMQR